MSKLSKAAASFREEAILRRDETVTNFMGGDSYKINPLDTLKMITASSIFGEPSYYRNSGTTSKADAMYVLSDYVTDSVLPDFYNRKTTVEIMESAIDSALSYDYAGTLAWAAELRTVYHIRLNPQIIMVRAALHPNRPAFTAAHPGEFARINSLVMSRADEPMTQMAYYLYKNYGKKNNIPSILKRSWADELSSLNSYKISKYKNHEIGMINAVRICHATSREIDVLMTTGTLDIPDTEKTWENLRSAGKSWREILDSINIGHMALLRNLRGIFTEIDDYSYCSKILKKLKDGVLNGKQLPFRYYNAYQVIMEDVYVNHKALILDTLEECMDISVHNLPLLPGKTMCLSDNSGSAWHTIPTEYGTIKIAEIDNLSSVITGVCSDEGYIGKFGDSISRYSASKRNGILSQAKFISTNGYDDVGGATEGGIWKFFRDAIKNHEHFDNIFIYSDQQAGHAGLYGTAYDLSEYEDKYSYGRYVNVYKLILEYRKRVNPKVNVFSIQTAGYDNVVIPEYGYRTAILYGWTGKEILFADALIKQWNEIESREKNK